MIIKNTNLIIGELESGKTRGICFPEIKKVINEEKNLFILDNKEEYYHRYEVDQSDRSLRSSFFLVSFRLSHVIDLLTFKYIQAGILSAIFSYINFFGKILENY